MMLEHLELGAAARQVEAAVAAVLAEGKTLPADLGGNASTTAVTDAVLEALG
jgi:isocitrate/isopropylmalate dehydrogenase